jgi:CRISPR-associated protein Cas5d
MSDHPYIRVRVSGPLACFTRPEAKVERVSYDVMTPSAARGLLEAILWKPQMRWIVRRIEVHRPIVFQAIRRNEVQSKISPRAVKGWQKTPSSFAPMVAGAGTSEGTPRGTLALREVAYVIEAIPHVFTPNDADTPTKYMAMFNERVARGQCFQRPYFGCREFAADFEAPRQDERPIDETRDLGLMLYDVVFRNKGAANRPVFFQARLEKGVLDTRPETALADAGVREEVLACSSRP